MVDLLDNFLDLIKLFLAVTSDFMKSLWGRMGGGKEKKKRRIVYRQSGERSAETSETKAFSNREPYKHILSKKLSAQCNAEYLGLPGIK
jgi:hypothetical protein